MMNQLTASALGRSPTDENGAYVALIVRSAARTNIEISDRFLPRKEILFVIRISLLDLSAATGGAAAAGADFWLWSMWRRAQKLGRRRHKAPLRIHSAVRKAVVEQKENSLIFDSSALARQ